MAGSSFDPSGYENLINQVLSQYFNTGKVSSKDYAKDLVALVNKIAEDPNRLTKKDLNKIEQAMKKAEAQKFGENAARNREIKSFFDELRKLSDSISINAEAMGQAGIAFKAELHALSERARRSGLGEEYMSRSTKEYKASAQAQKEDKEFTPKHIDSAVDKICGFFKNAYAKTKVEMKHFGEDLIEGLSKSKFIGGALTDLLRLASFFAANWLKNFGPIGKALAVGVVALAPIMGNIIANILAKSLTGALTGVWKLGLAGLGTLLKSVFMSFTNSRLLAASIQGRAGASALTGITGGNLALGSLLGAGVLGTLAADSFKKGGVRENTAGGFLTAGAIGLGVTGLAAAFGVALSPVILPLTAIATGVGLVVKFWPQIMDFVTKVLQMLGFIAEDKKGGKHWKLPWENKDVDHPVGGGSKRSFAENSPIYKDTVFKSGTDTTGILKIGASGEITNLDELPRNKKTLDAIKSYAETNPKAFNNIYEWANWNIADKNSFQNDIFDEEKGAFVYKGATADILAQRKILESALRKKGESEDSISKKVSELQIKSGRSSLSSKHAKRSYAEKYKTHGDFFNLGQDVGGGASWSVSDWDLYTTIGKEYYKNRNLTAAYETGGKYDTTPQYSTENAHLDIKNLKNIRPAGAIENLNEAKSAKEQMVNAVQQSLKLKQKELQEEVNKGTINNPDEKRDEEKIKQKVQELKELEKELKRVKEEPLSGYWTGSEVFSNYFNRLRSSQTINGIDNFR